ncbi:MAG: Crp/Fnr family transcriptional regulator [Thermodesulfovibrionales bacterium]|nr:Crp/Fnr family transcriptional regulator [Thermodesulfovibrionales bacterium]
MIQKLKKQYPLYILKKIPFFGVLTDEELTELQKKILHKKFFKNEVVLLEEDTPHYLYIIYSGKVKVIKTTLDGKEQILAIHKKGDFFGEMSLLDNKTAPATVIAMEESHIGLLSKNNFENFFLRDNRLLNQIIFILCERLREAWMMLKVLGLKEADKKIRALLKIISFNYSVKDSRGTLITIRLSQKDLASYTSLSRETVSRILDKLESEGEIEFIDKKYILLKPLFFKNSENI